MRDNVLHLESSVAASREARDTSRSCAVRSQSVRNGNICPGPSEASGSHPRGWASPTRRRALHRPPRTARPRGFHQGGGRRARTGASGPHWARTARSPPTQPQEGAVSVGRRGLVRSGRAGPGGKSHPLKLCRKSGPPRPPAAGRDVR